jgi:hypothetical protein
VGAQGTATLDFGATPTEDASVVVTGQAGVLSGSLVEAWFMRSTTADNTADDHEAMSIYCPLVCGDIVVGTGFTIRANMYAGLAIGQFTVCWAWN